MFCTAAVFDARNPTPTLPRACYSYAEPLLNSAALVFRHCCDCSICFPTVPGAATLQAAYMPFSALAGILTLLIAAESAAFVSLPTKTAGITRWNRSGGHVRSRTLLHMMMGKKGGGGGKTKQKKKRGWVVGADAEKGADAVEAAAEDGGRDVPSLVAMDLDYTLW